MRVYLDYLREIDELIESVREGRFRLTIKGGLVMWIIRTKEGFFTIFKVEKSELLNKKELAKKKGEKIYIRRWEGWDYEEKSESS